MDQSRLGARLGAAQAGFDFAPHFLNRIEVRGVGNLVANLALIRSALLRLLNEHHPNRSLPEIQFGRQHAAQHFPLQPLADMTEFVAVLYRSSARRERSLTLVPAPLLLEGAILLKQGSCRGARRQIQINQLRRNSKNPLDQLADHQAK